MKTILAVLGDIYHRADMAEDALRRAAETLRDVALWLADEDRLAEGLEAMPDAVVMFKMDRRGPGEETRWLTTPVQERIARYVERGGSWLAWHSGLACQDPDGPYVRMLRGRFRHHPEGERIVRYSGVQDGFGLAPAQPFEIADEHYFTECDAAATSVFLRSSSADGEAVAGWAHRHGKGKVCCFAPAHGPSGLAHEGVTGALGRILRWLLE